MRRSAPGLSVVVAALLSSAPVFANGAFPDSLEIFAPADAPDRLILGTNFGVLISDDSGAHWRWVCETAVVPGAFLYQLGPGPADRIFAVSAQSLSSSIDVACSFAPVTAGLESTRIQDAFPDPSNADHVLVLARADQTGARMGVYESSDGGHKFSRPRFFAPTPDIALTSIEIARSSPDAIYLAGYSRASLRPMLFRSDDRGGSYNLVAPDLTPVIGARLPLIAGIDAQDSARIYLRLFADASDGFAISEDGGGTVRVTLELDTKISGFLQRDDGSLIVGTRTGTVYTSTSGGRSFHPQSGWPLVRALAERNGDLLVAADDVRDGYAVGVSRDQGHSFQPLLRFAEIAGILPCGSWTTDCASSWLNLQMVLGLTSTTSAQPDGGSRSDAALAPETDGGSQPGADAAASTVVNKSCSCRSSTPSAAGALVFGLPLLLVLGLAPRRRRAVLLLMLMTLASAVATPRAWADGAFPDSLQIFLPPDQPHRVVVATNFGLLISEDDGASWRWVCEEAISFNAFLYSLGPPPVDRLYAVDVNGGLVFSEDGACSFSQASLGSGPPFATDAFPDPGDALHVLALARPAMPNATAQLYESIDAGKHFTGPHTVTATAGVLTGVEIARSNPQLVYLTLGAHEPIHPYLLRSSDGGRSFETHRLGDARLDGRSPRLIGIDPEDPDRVYLRMLGDLNDGIAVSMDGGRTSTLSLDLSDAVMTTFLRRADRSLLVGVNVGGGWRSTDGGNHFTPWATTIHLRGLGERDGVLWAVADNFADHFAVGISHDDGASWEPKLRFVQIGGVKACGQLATVCAAPWLKLADTFGITSTVGNDGGLIAKPEPSGCHCNETAGGAYGLLVLLAAALLTGTVSRRRATAGPSR